MVKLIIIIITRFVEIVPLSNRPSGCISFLSKSDRAPSPSYLLWRNKCKSAGLASPRSPTRFRKTLFTPLLRSPGRLLMDRVGNGIRDFASAGAFPCHLFHLLLFCPELILSSRSSSKSLIDYQFYLSKWPPTLGFPSRIDPN